jgi:hypothetical protein
MFDAASEIEIGIYLASGAQSVTVRWPTDQEWAARARWRKIMVRRHPRGATEHQPPPPSEKDVALYEKVALNGVATVTKGEAHQIFDRLAVATVTGVEIEGHYAIVDLIVYTGETVRHRVKIPTADQVISMRAAALHMLDLPYNQQQLTIHLEPSARLWDDCQGSSEDYANGVVPAIHKDAAIRAVIDYLDHNLGPRRDDENF